MSTSLKDMQFEILPWAEADSGVPFGIGLDVSVNEDGFSPGGPDWYTEDSENPINGATSFGRDHLLGPSWQWALHVNRDRTSAALQSLGELATAWRAPEIRDQVGAVLAIRYQLDNRVRRVFGRPRRFEYSPTNLLLSGFVPISADFKCADAYTYDDVESAVTMDLQLEPVGGLIFPTVLPQALLPSGSHDGQALVLGDAETYPVIRFEGPITNPTVGCEDWILSLGGTTTYPTFTLADGEYVEIDTRPWSQSVLFNGDTSVAGALGKRQWISHMKMKPGAMDFRFTGSSAQPGATCEVRWRSAWNSI